MRRSVVVALIGWLIGIVTASVYPTIAYETRSVAAYDFDTRQDNSPRILKMPSDGWVLKLAHDGIYTFERPRLRF